MERETITRLATALKDIIDREGKYAGILEYWNVAAGTGKGMGNIRYRIGDESHFVVAYGEDIAGNSPPIKIGNEVWFSYDSKNPWNMHKDYPGVYHASNVRLKLKGNNNAD